MLGVESWLDLGLGAWWAGVALLGMVRGPVPEDDAMSTDAALVDAVRAGDATAYRGLVEKYQGRVYNVIYGLVRNREDAQELTQETFVKAYRNLHGFRSDSRFYTWVYRIAMNLAIDFTRRRKRAPISGTDEDIGVRDSRGEIADVHHIDSPRKALERKQLHRAIMDALDQLPEQQKQVILLREIEGLSYREIAEVLDLVEGTVMSRLFYARKKLQKVLEEERATW
jgi:RNA polymerase sigma-70 factor (ECF subfamily)